ncbi:MAG: hypothetical protein Q4C83_01835 [Candidatus Saccharibacteria bacterium]|nr:hypothetical protein [Candidatus Saccharibacteria bacterium]
MKINISKLLLSALFSIIAIVLLAFTPAQAKISDSQPVNEQRWVISEIYLGKTDYQGAYLELYNNDDHNALGWKDFIINLPFDIDLPPIFDLHTYKPHTYKTIPLDEGWVGWLTKKYIQIIYGDELFYEIRDALDEQDGYSYQRCQSTYDDGTRVISNKFYYGKKSPDKPIDCDDKTLRVSNPDDLPDAGQCANLKLNEIGSYLYEEEQFIELRNTGNTTINLSNCYISKSKADSAIHQQLEDYDLEAGGLYSFNVEATELTPLTKSSGIIYVIDSDDKTVVDYKRYTNNKEKTSTALDNNGQWKTTYNLTPGASNIIDEYPACPDGEYRDSETHRCHKESSDSDNDTDDTDEDKLKPCKEGYERNPQTNRCRKIVDDDEELDENGLKPCKEGYERNPETNRCRKIVDEEDELTPCKDGYIRNPATNRCIKDPSLATESTLVPCKEGYERNPETNRCVKITSSESKLTPCKDGYERNPETNRCVKIKTSTTNSSSDKDANAKFPVTLPADSSDSTVDSTTSLLIVIAIIAIASVAILIWQYRTEISRWWQKVTAKTKNSTDSTTSVKVALDNNSDTTETTSDWLDKLTDK